MAAIYSATHTSTVYGEYYFLTRQAIWYATGFVALCTLLVLIIVNSNISPFRYISWALSCCSWSWQLEM